MSKFGKFSVTDDADTSSTSEKVERVKVGIQIRKDLKKAVAVAAADEELKEYQIYEAALELYFKSRKENS
ncbi:hypothetical protein [Deinococcus cellulosilyticus]|uniref:Uncharacterized protein n=1 Tax=Deinococcus cellulosilyticus (strain DSM 18568 / NBRC 106333 / KACC 11606 / 5516J-15) TaxID=1223518 RepID=A0A511NAK1_DEIC1|nr:hypothetical protein [Deinococcus cellulosilyticus]GEM49852.1 hypothetical protein DC3_54870 [Deinococcus cellulosilyticus NBRC 106333 = KACC 11606]